MSKRSDLAKRRLQKLFKENPELRKAYKETIDELSKPDNIEKMTSDVLGFMRYVQEKQSGLKSWILKFREAKNLDPKTPINESNKDEFFEYVIKNAESQQEKDHYIYMRNKFNRSSNEGD